MATLTRNERRINRKHILDALVAETGGHGGDPAASYVSAYCKDPLSSDTATFNYVGALRLTRFYIDPSKPNTNERRSLWQEITSNMGTLGAADPGGWGGSTSVRTLQIIVESSIGTASGEAAI